MQLCPRKFVFFFLNVGIINSKMMLIRVLPNRVVLRIKLDTPQIRLVYCLHIAYRITIIFIVNISCTQHRKFQKIIQFALIIIILLFQSVVSITSSFYSPFKAEQNTVFIMLLTYLKRLVLPYYKVKYKCFGIQGPPSSITNFFVSDFSVTVVIQKLALLL